MALRPVAYDHFYGYDELTATLRAWADEAPELCSVEPIGRSWERPYPREQQDDGLRVQDVDGDGRVLDMRLEDPNGAWKVHAEERRLLVRRDPVDGPEDGPFYRLVPEGRIENYDGVTIKIP